jgi:ketosteroid isomerase-like protein
MPLSPDDVVALRAAEQDLEEALNDPDPTAWVDFYTDDAIFIGHGRPALEGREALLDYSHRMTQFSSLRIEPLSTDGDGNIATVFANVTGAVDGADVLVRSLLVWRRGPDGRWRVAREMLNTSG